MINPLRRGSPWLLLCIASSFLFDQSASANIEEYPDGLKKWTTADSIAVRYYGEIADNYASNARAPAAIPSPDGRYFYVMSSHGDLTCTCVVQTLELFETIQVSQWLMKRSASLKPLA